jgi:Tfp pilus assembly ATPase PilU
MEREQASRFVNDLLKLLISRNGSDLFITADFPRWTTPTPWPWRAPS